MFIETIFHHSLLNPRRAGTDGVLSHFAGGTGGVTLVGGGHVAVLPWDVSQPRRGCGVARTLVICVTGWHIKSLPR